jgi:hypothetical protein
MDENSETGVVDNKPPALPMFQASADEKRQMPVYACLLAVNKYVLPSASVKFRFIDSGTDMPQPIWASADCAHQNG